MTERQILRLPEPRETRRLPGQPAFVQKPVIQGRQAQEARYGEQFNRLEQMLAGEDAEVVLRRDPVGIAPERALVFVTAVPIQDFIKRANQIGLEVISEVDLPEHLFEDGFIDRNASAAKPTLYATMPSQDALLRLTRLWNRFKRGEVPERGLKPWWDLFEMLAELRVWGPQDRFNEKSREELQNRLPLNEDDEVKLELEIWPTRNQDLRRQWEEEARDKVIALGGRIIDRCSIDEEGFSYLAILIGMSAGSVRQLIDDPNAPNGLATLEGLQFILPQTIAQSIPEQSEDQVEHKIEQHPPFDDNSPYRAILLDGTPVAGHDVLDGGVAIEDVHQLVPLSLVEHRKHATSMASLILRGDLKADGLPLNDTRLLSIPVLVDANHGTSSLDERLFVDIVHLALTKAFLGDAPLAPEAFVVNFSIGIRGSHYSGQLSSLARLLDWWADVHGVLFMVSAGNVVEALSIPNITTVEFENLSIEERRHKVEEARKLVRHTRTLLAPAEALNVLTVGALDSDLFSSQQGLQQGELEIAHNSDNCPAISSANGLGPLKSIKPDLLHIGGRHNVKVMPNGNDVILKVVNQTHRTGLNVASTTQGTGSVSKSRGTSCATALSTRSHLASALTLTADGGPYENQRLPRRDLALLTRALSVNSARWPNAASALYARNLAENRHRHINAKEDVARYYGHGHLNEERMIESSENGVTLVGLGTIRKGQGRIFDLPLPASLSGEKIGRSMLVTLSWFSPVDAVRANYRLAGLEAVVSDSTDHGDVPYDSSWMLDLKSDQLDRNMIKRGTIWSKRLVRKRVTTPIYDDQATMPIRVQCRDTANGGLDPSEDIRFAIAISLEVDAQTLFDIHQELENKMRVQVRPGGG